MGWSLLLGPLSHHIFLCVQSHNGVTHSPSWGIWGLVLFYLQLLKKLSDIAEVTKNTAKSYNQLLHVLGWWEDAGLRSLPRASGCGGWAKLGPLLLRPHKKKVNHVRKSMGKAEAVAFLESQPGPRSALPGGAALRVDHHVGGQKVECVEFLFTHMDHDLQSAVPPELGVLDLGPNKADNHGETESQLKGSREVT